jgi:hypothetical protein
MPPVAGRERARAAGARPVGLGPLLVFIAAGCGSPDGASRDAAAGDTGGAVDQRAPVDAGTAPDAAASLADARAPADTGAIPDVAVAQPTDAADAADAAAPAACAVTPPGSRWAEWPVPDPTTTGARTRRHSYDTSTPGVVLDRVTGLTWERAVDPGMFTRDGASERCACLMLGGHEDWRLPTRIELVSLVDFTRTDPSIDVGAFPDTPFEWFWSSSLVEGDPAVAWYVAFFDGNTHKNSVDVEHRVRCVRGPAAADAGAPAQRYTVPGDGTLVDTRTGLAWQRAVDATNRTWNDARTACARLPLAGGGWRLPDMKELQTLIDETRSEPAIDVAAFPGTPNESFWTSTPLAGMPSDAWFVAFPTGISYSNGIERLYRMRCVR